MREHQYKDWVAILLGILVFFVGCSSNESSETKQDTFANGQPKTTIHKTIDERNTYYEITYDSLGRIRKMVPYANGVKNGTEVYFGDSLHVAALLHHVEGKRDGFTYEFHTRQETMFKGEAKGGEFNGVSTWFHINGIPEQTGMRVNGQKEGKWTEYHENGQVRAEGAYSNGVKQKDWQYWNKDGNTATIDNTD